MTAITPRRSPPQRKKRSPAYLLAQILGGGVAGILIALIILKLFGADYFGFGRNQQGPTGISDDRKLASAKPDANPNSKTTSKPPTTTPKSRTEKPNSRPANSSSNPPVYRSSDEPPDFEPPSESEKPASSLLESSERAPIPKEKMAEFFAKAKLSPATKYWWCEQGVFEFDDRGGFAFTARNAPANIYWPADFTEQYLELDNEAHNQRLRLYIDHAESSAPPFDAYKTLYAAGKWIVTVDQTGVDWFARAVGELDSTSRQSRVAAKEYMINLFGAADKLKTAGKLKDIPFGFDLPAERERFNTTGLVPFTTPLLPMTAEYIQECRKMHKNEEAAYNRIALRLNGQREKPARDFLEYHQWRHARAWPLAILAWKDETSTDTRLTLLSNGAVNDDASKNTWKLTSDILDVAAGAKRVRLKISQTGKEFTLIGSNPATTGKFLFEPARVAY